MQLIKKYFPQLNDIQLNKLLHFEKLIKEWNKKINLVYSYLIVGHRVFFSNLQNLLHFFKLI